MAALIIASKANQATTLPTLLIAARANESDPNAKINIKFQEVDNLQDEGGATLKLVTGTSAPILGAEEIIARLVSNYASLHEEQEDLVGWSSTTWNVFY